MGLSDRPSGSTTSSTLTPGPPSQLNFSSFPRRVSTPSACTPCKRSHLACEASRPCGRCIKLGKTDDCEDAPQLKRGRPRKLKRSSTRSPSVDSSSLTACLERDVFTPTGFESGFDYPSLLESFELFTTTDFKILRATDPCYHLTGFHPHEFINIPLQELVFPDDWPQMKHHQMALTNPLDGPARLRTSRQAQAALTQLDDLRLRVPAQGMVAPFPNENVRVVRNDGTYALFNVRIHLGGALEGCLRELEQLDSSYFAISLLILRSSDSPILVDKVIPPTPLTPSVGPISRPQTESSSVDPPGFSTFAAAAALRETSRYALSPSSTRQDGFAVNSLSLETPFETWRSSAVSRLRVQYQQSWYEQAGDPVREQGWRRTYLTPTHNGSHQGLQITGLPQNAQMGTSCQPLSAYTDEYGDCPRTSQPDMHHATTARQPQEHLRNGRQAAWPIDLAQHPLHLTYSPENLHWTG
ncbi:hypothetical protein BD324DRAFT_678080 [Kockovaella imperatae]|uniref:Transcription activator of gluconeogenesis ERT1 n=1 Tax=Kockovaella imperatae TaxID=4999 RepID=A0A1Y1USX9_9TREE|nr:hypothetical protein BD324DRAFT_678080 [Kockovaella imperatae]ORX40634.1 hypothetical protein BD324DRAFT_678080 [Kockovaella imperatae]